MPPTVVVVVMVQQELGYYGRRVSDDIDWVILCLASSRLAKICIGGGELGVAVRFISILWGTELSGRFRFASNSSGKPSA